MTFLTSYTPALVLMLLFLVMLLAWVRFLYMPGRRYLAALPPLNHRQERIDKELRRLLHRLCMDIGERNLQRAPAALGQAASFLTQELQQAGFTVTRQEFVVNKRHVANLEAVVEGRNPAAPALVIGAHYDTVPFSPGANDNGSAVAAALVLAKAFVHSKPACPIRFVFFVNEESPYFGTQDQGSMRYAQACQERGERLMGMICLETIGYYSDAARSQNYPFPLEYFFPKTGNFIAFVADAQSRRFLNQLIGNFRRLAAFPSEGVVAPHGLRDICRSDHYSFWKHHYPAVMVTDTANFRYEYYHMPEDTPGRLSVDRLARVVDGLGLAIQRMTGMED